MSRNSTDTSVKRRIQFASGDASAPPLARAGSVVDSPSEAGRGTGALRAERSALAPGRPAAARALLSPATEAPGAMELLSAAEAAAEPAEAVALATEAAALAAPAVSE